MASGAVGLALYQPGFLFRILDDHPIARTSWGRLRSIARIGGIDPPSEHRLENHIAVDDAEPVLIVPLVGDAGLGCRAARLRVVL